MIANPILQAREDIVKYETQLDILNNTMVGSIRAQLYREKVVRGEKLDSYAAQYLYTCAITWGTEQHLSRMRADIVDTIELQSSAELMVKRFDDAMHAAQHEVLGECMYQTDEYYNKNTGYYEPILSQYCDVWKEGPK